MTYVSPKMRAWNKRLASTYNTTAVAAFQRGERIPLVKCMVPSGRTSYTIYAVSLKEHAGVVKVGQTAKWEQRLRTYQFWNLSRGDAVDRATRFVLNDEFVDLKKLEAHVLHAVAVDHELHYASEWFKGDYDDIVRLIDRVIAETGLAYEIL